MSTDGKKEPYERVVAKLKGLKRQFSTMLGARRNCIVLVLLIVSIVLGSALRVYNLSYRSLWYDEIRSVDISEEYSIMQLIQYSSASRLPPLYHIILHVFLYLGDNEFVARLPSVIFGTLSILLIYKVGALFFGRREGLISAALLSISTMHIQYSQEARMYSLAVFLSLLSIYFFVKALRDPHIWLWTGFVVFTLLGIFTHFYLLLIPLIELPPFVFMLLRKRGAIFSENQRLGRKKIILSILGFAALAVVLFPLMQSASMGILTALEVGYAFEVSWGLNPSISSLVTLFDHFNTGGFLPQTLVDWRASIFYLLLIALLVGVFASLKEYKSSAALLLLWIFLPIIAVFILTIVLGKPIADPKYMIFILPGYLIGISRGVSCIADSLSKRFKFLSNALPESEQVISLVLALAVFLGLSVLPLQQYYIWKKPDWRSAGEYLRANSTPGDLVIVRPIMCMSHYYDPRLHGTSMIPLHDSLINDIESSSADLGSIRIWNAIDVKRLTDGQIYEISIWYRGNMTVQVYVLFQDVNWQNLAITGVLVNATQEWKQVILTTDPVSPELTHASLNFLGEAKGYFLIDDCTMSAQNQMEINVLSNGGFEEGLISWKFERTGGKTGQFDRSTESRTGHNSGELKVEAWVGEASSQGRMFFVYSIWHASSFDVEGKIRNWLQTNSVEMKRFHQIIIYHYQRRMVLVQTKDMRFEGLDSPPDEPIASFWHDNDSATFRVQILEDSNYTVAIHARSITKSAVELLIDGVSQGTHRFCANEWTLVELSTLHLESTQHELKIVNREGEDLGDTDIIFDVVALYPS